MTAIADQRVFIQGVAESFRGIHVLSKHWHKMVVLNRAVKLDW